MTTVYVLTSGTYSEYGVRAIYSTRELAERAKAIANTVAYDEHNIEEFELDPPAVVVYSQRYGRRHDGTEFDYAESDVEFGSGQPAVAVEEASASRGRVNVRVSGTDRERVQKVARDRLAQLLAEQQEPVDVSSVVSDPLGA